MRKPSRSHKSKKEQKRLAKKATTKILGNGFVQRTAKPKVTGDDKKSRLVRIDARFAEFLRQQAKIHGTITNVTRRLYKRASVLAVMIEQEKVEVEE